MKEKKRNYEKEKKNIWYLFKTGKMTTAAHITQDKDFQELRKNFSPAFNSVFEKGYQHYLNGDWVQARLALEKGLDMKPSDGPTKTLLRIIEDGDGKAPEKWKGFRALMSK